MRSRAVAAIMTAGVLTLSVAGCKGFGPQNANSEGTAVHLKVNTSQIQRSDKDWTAGGKTIEPTAIVLHWTDGADNNNVGEVISGLNSNRTGFDLNARSTDPHPENHHTTVQFTVMRDGTAYQLTPQPNTQARHATCANAYAIGIEIKGSKPGSRNYIGNYPTQLKGVVALVKELQQRYNIPTKGHVAKNGRSGSGILTHAMVDAKCTWTDGEHYGTGKVDVDKTYYKRVLAALN